MKPEENKCDYRVTVVVVVYGTLWVHCICEREELRESNVPSQRETPRMRQPHGAERVEVNGILQNLAKKRRARMTQYGSMWVPLRDFFMVREGQISMSGRKRLRLVQIRIFFMQFHGR